MGDRRRRGIRLAGPAGAVGLALVAAGCGGDDRVTLRVASWADAVEQRIEERYVHRFGERHPGVRVSLEAVTTQAEYRERILTSIAAASPPDVFLLDNIDVPAFAARDVLLDLGPYAARAGLDTALLDPRVREIFTVDGRLVAFPKGFTPLVLVYNKRLFDAAGLPYPSGDWTWDEFMRAAKALTRDTDGDGVVDQWGTVFDRRVWLWIPWIWSGGGDVLCPDGRRASGCLDAPATREALRWYLDWVRRDSVVPRVHTLRRSLGDHHRLFNSGRVAMLTAGHFWIPNFRPYVEQGRIAIGFAPIPHRAGVPPATVIYASGWAVPRNVPRRRLAVELAAFMADTLAQRTRAERGLEIPSLSSLAAELAARDTMGWEAVFVHALGSGRVPWGARVRGWREVEDRLPTVIDEVLLEGRDLDAALRDAARDLDRLLARTER
ncbi:MAG TPA: sugar ABC transporter substrate-binding protein [Gemmatimonadales bacterium]|nr:sugar ABC transporter substrate-binding protein [Gemmatimonadales bacterium]